MYLTSIFGVKLLKAMVHWTICPSVDQRKHQSSVSLAFVRGIHRLPVNSPHKGPVTRKKFPLDDVIMIMKGVAMRDILWWKRRYQDLSVSRSDLY